MAAEDPALPLSDPTTALEVAQKAPNLLTKASSIATTLPWSLIGTPEAPETWMGLAQLFYACLQTRDDKSAHLCLEKLTRRFGAENDKIMAMRGLYQEAVAEDEAELKKILSEYGDILDQNPVNLAIHKRRIALIRSIGRPQDAINSLVGMLDSFPMDVEGWCELSDLYLSQGMGSQAVFCLEEALLSVPNAWNLHARIGELEYMNAVAAGETAEARQRALTQALQRFSRSIELCDDYLRGYYGLKLAVDKLLSSSKQSRSGDSIPPEKLEQLDRLATAKLKAIVQARTSTKRRDVDEAELIAAKELLDRSNS